MKLLKFLLVFHIVFSILLIILILFGTEIFQALGWDIPWDEMVNDAAVKVRDATYAGARALRSATINAADWLSDMLGAVSRSLASWVAEQKS